MFAIKKDAPYKLHSKTKELKGDPEIVEIHRTDRTLVFDLKNVEPAIANALRRIMISEVPTVAVKMIGLSRNTSIIQDEVLAHRIGLMPIDFDPERLNPGERLNFDLDALGVAEKPDKTLPKELKEYFSTTRIYAKDFQWIPKDDQEERFADNPPKVLEDDILIARLAPHTQIHLRARCTVGIGKDHAKWSPVATAFYRNMPKIELKPLAHELGEKFVNSCKQNVFDIEESHVVVKDARACTMCRECIRKTGTENAVELYQDSNHFIFTVESVGAIPPKQILLRAIKILGNKAETLLKERKTSE